MLGLVVILAVSQLLLYIFQRKSLLVLGPTPLRVRIFEFFMGFMLATVLALITVVADTAALHIVWSHNFSSLSLLGSSFIYHLRSALTEDLLFRGAVLYILYKRFNIHSATLAMALAFGIYHWFSYGMLEGNVNLVALIFVMITTGANGYVWGYTYLRTGSVIMPLAMHTAWNFVLTLFYETQPYGELLFEGNANMSMNEWTSLALSLFKGIFPPLLMWICVRYYLRTINTA